MFRVRVLLTDPAKTGTVQQLIGEYIIKPLLINPKPKKKRDVNSNYCVECDLEVVVIIDGYKYCISHAFKHIVKAGNNSDFDKCSVETPEEFRTKDN